MRRWKTPEGQTVHKFLHPIIAAFPGNAERGQREAVKLPSDSHLGRLNGNFGFEATVTNTDFAANYLSSKDCGTFVLSRCCESCCEQDCQ